MAEFNLRNIIFNGPEDAATTVALAHGAGAPMDSDFMQFFAESIGTSGYRVARFEFPFMAERRTIGKKKPPNRIEQLLDSWNTTIKILEPDNLVIGGKSLGARTASLIADTAKVRGLICLGYPFHAPGKEPGPNRLDHLLTLQTPTLICQGTRDALGSLNEVTEYQLSHKIHLHWIEDGDHGLKPRKISGRTENQNWEQANDAITKFLNML